MAESGAARCPSQPLPRHGRANLWRCAMSALLVGYSRCSTWPGAGRATEAATAYRRAGELTDDSAVATFLLERADAIRPRNG
jgi:hypothetical protein